MTLPVFKTGDRHLRCRWCVRLAHASAIYLQQLTSERSERFSPVESLRRSKCDEIVMIQELTPKETAQTYAMASLEKSCKSVWRQSVVGNFFHSCLWREAVMLT